MKIEMPESHVIVYSKIFMIIFKNKLGVWNLKYCVDCKYFSTKVRGSNRELYDGSCSLFKKNAYETNVGCKEFKEEQL